MHLQCPHCHNPIELVDAAALAEVICPSCGSSIQLSGPDSTTDLTGGAEVLRIGPFELRQLSQPSFHLSQKSSHFVGIPASSTVGLPCLRDVAILPPRGQDEHRLRLPSAGNIARVGPTPSDTLMHEIKTSPFIQTAQ